LVLVAKLINLKIGLRSHLMGDALGAMNADRTAAPVQARFVKPRLQFWQIWNMSFGFLGIQFGWGLQMSNMSPIYKYLGAADSEIPMLWLAAPLTGLIVQPIIGAMSDRTWAT
jgi:hypothetical protein